MADAVDTAPALRLEALGKTYAPDVKAVSDVSLSVRPGEVYGFLGPNGAGKSTTIRMALGLIRPTCGRVFLFGEEVTTRSSRHRVGSLVDGGTFYAHLTGRENLAVLAYTQGGGTERIDGLLARVGLAADGNRKVKGYSLGMRQRLGVASALLNDPDLVILDEPANGLDAAGIQDMRDLVRSLALEGKAVFLSSHLLHEVQQVCDRVAIVTKGRLVREASIAELVGTDAGIQLVAHPLEQAFELLGPRWRTERRAGSLWLAAEEADVPEIVRHLVASGIDVLRIGPEQQSLEEIFLAMTRDEQ